MKLTNTERILANPSPEIERRVEIRMAILERIHELLQSRFNGRQKDLAAALSISEAAVSKMINGYQNFELDTIIRLEMAFGDSILAVCSSEKHAEFIPARTSIAYAKLLIHKDGALADSNYTPGHTTRNIQQISWEE